MFSSACQACWLAWVHVFTEWFLAPGYEAKVQVRGRNEFVIPLTSFRMAADEESTDP
jgi:hypothetical protein